MLDQVKLKDLLDYNPDSGVFTRKIRTSNSVNIGDIAGNRHSMGYWEISVCGKRYLAHRLVFLYMTGEWPEDQVDHINGNRSDNRWLNLREATNSQNGLNKPVRKTSCTGVKNVHRNGKGYIVRMKINGKDRCFGTYSDIELAELVAVEAADKYQGGFKFNP